MALPLAGAEGAVRHRRPPRHRRLHRPLLPAGLRGLVPERREHDDAVATQSFDALAADPSYTDETWIADKVQLIPRLRNWVNTYHYPGTPPGTWLYRVQAFNGGGVSAYSNQATIRVK